MKEMEEFALHAKNLKQNLNILEATSALTELAILGDKKIQDIFDLFIEEKIIEEFVRVLRQTKDTNIVNAIINSVCMLITNIEKNIVVILSLPQLNEFIIYDYFLSNDETLDYYINLIKILSNKVTTKNIGLFFNQKYAQFPLLLYSQNFYNSKENLPKTYSRHILLKILQNTEQSCFSLSLKRYLMSYPFTQILANHINFMKDLLEKWVEKTQYYEEELKNMFFFFKDLYANAIYLKNILDNLFLQIIIIPQFQNLSSKDSKLISTALAILQIFFTQETMFSSQLPEVIMILCFSSEIPKLEVFQFPHFQPTKDPQLMNVCASFFKDQEKKIKEDEKKVKEEEKKWFLQNLSTSISVSIQNIPSLFYTEQDSQKFQLFQRFQFEDGISKLLQNFFFKENDLSQLEFTYNQYNIYTILNSLNDDHYYQILSLVQLLVDHQKFDLLTQEQRSNFIINMTKVMIDQNHSNLNSIRNCIKSTNIILHMLQPEDKQFFLAFTKSSILREIEMDVQTSTIVYYRYFRKMIELINEEKYQIIEQIPEGHQMARFLLFLNLSFKKQWLVNQFTEFHHPIEYEDKNYGRIQIKGLIIIVETIELNIEDWYLQREQNNKKIYLENLISKEKMEIVLEDEQQQIEFMKQVETRQENLEQHVIAQIIKSLHKFYY